VKVRAPLLSLQARGRIANTVTFSTIRRRHHANLAAIQANFAAPADPGQRSALAAAVDFWQTVLDDDDARAPWDRAARVDRLKGSGYHAAVAAASTRLNTEASPSLAWKLIPDEDFSLSAILRDVRTHALATDTGAVSLYAGATPYSLSLLATAAIDDGCLTFSSLASEDTKLYCRLVKDGRPVSGLHVVTLQEDPVSINLTVNNLTIEGDASIAGTPSGFGGFTVSPVGASQLGNTADFTQNGAMQTFDLSSKVPEGTKAIFATLRLKRVSTYPILFVYTPSGWSRQLHTFYEAPVRNYTFSHMAVIPLSTSRTFRYLVHTPSFNLIDFRLGGTFA